MINLCLVLQTEVNKTLFSIFLTWVEAYNYIPKYLHIKMADMFLTIMLMYISVYMFVSIHLTIQIKLCNSYTMESISDTHRDFLQFTRLGIRSMPPPPPRAAWPRLSASGHRVSWSCQSSAAATRTLPTRTSHQIQTVTTDTYHPILTLPTSCLIVWERGFVMCR